MQTSAATGPATLTPFSITQIATSIYEPSAITFNNDTNAYIKVDIIYSALKKIYNLYQSKTLTYSAISSS